MDELIRLTTEQLLANGVNVGGNQYPYVVVRHGGSRQGPWGLRKRVVIQTRYFGGDSADDVTNKAYMLDRKIDQALTEMNR